MELPPGDGRSHEDASCLRDFHNRGRRKGVASDSFCCLPLSSVVFLFFLVIFPSSLFFLLPLPFFPLSFLFIFRFFLVFLSVFFRLIFRKRKKETEGFAIVPTPNKTRNPGLPESACRIPKNAILAPQETAPKNQVNGPKSAFNAHKLHLSDHLIGFWGTFSGGGGRKMAFVGL